jgi:hypothetical protein
MTLISSGVGKRPVNQHDELSNRRCSWCKPRWLQGRREADELARWATEVMWQWNDTTDNTNLAHRTVLPGQVIDDFAAEAHHLAADMDVPTVRVTPCGHGSIEVTLLTQEPVRTAALPVPA